MLSLYIDVLIIQTSSTQFLELNMTRISNLRFLATHYVHTVYYGEGRLLNSCKNIDYVTMHVCNFFADFFLQTARVESL